MNREQAITGYWTAFNETAENPAAHDALQRHLVLNDLFFLLCLYTRPPRHQSRPALCPLSGSRSRT